MSSRYFIVVSAVLAAGCAAIGLYQLAHDAFGFSRYSIETASFGSAVFLAFVWLFTAAKDSRAK
jgi:hypothetical protein